MRSLVPGQRGSPLEVFVTFGTSVTLAVHLGLVTIEIGATIKPDRTTTEEKIAYFTISANKLTRFTS